MRVEQAPTPSLDEQLARFLAEYRRNVGSALDVSVLLTRRGVLELQRVQVSEDEQGNQIGSNFLAALTEFADQYSLPIVIHQVGGYAGQTPARVEHLVAWYQGFGFRVSNSYGGTTWPAMRRDPKGVE